MAAGTHTEQCDTHHWMLPAPGGPTSLGTCKHCGAEKEFSNATGRTWIPRSAAKTSAAKSKTGSA